MSPRDKMLKALNKLTKWRAVFTGWQLGTRAMNDPESQAVRDTFDRLIVLRAEQSAMVAVLIAKGVFTADEYAEAVTKEAGLADEDLQKRFPGFIATDDGITMTPEAIQTMARYRFKP